MAIKILSVDDEQDLEALLTQYFRRKIRKEMCIRDSSSSPQAVKPSMVIVHRQNDKNTENAFFI